MLLAAIASCHKKPSNELANGSATPVAQPADAAAAAVPAWTAASHPIELTCGDDPLKLTPPQAAAAPPAHALKRGDAFAQCHDEASIEAACDCLAKSIATWGKKFLLAGPATCAAQPNAGSDGAIVMLQDNPADPDSHTGGSALVMLAKRGATWSAISVVETSGDIDLSQTPKLGGSVKLVGFDAHPGSLYSIETQNETHESDMGEHELQGAATATLCAVPNDPHADAVCYVPLSLGSWSYTWLPKEGSCEIKKLAIFKASFDATGATLQLEYGSDSARVGGRYQF